jgi:DNA-binding CsgD family transcriptional regulator
MDTTTTAHNPTTTPSLGAGHPLPPPAPTVTDALAAAAWLGHPAVRPACRALLEHPSSTASEWAGASRALILLDLADGDYTAAARLSQQLLGNRPPDLSADDLANAVEAGTRASRLDKLGSIGDLVARLDHEDPSAHATALACRARALLVAGDAAELDYRRSIHQLEEAGSEREVARGHLLLGEWLRRRKRRADAHTHLAAARDLFEQYGATAFASRADRELVAIGANPRRRVDDQRLVLTAQEHQVARLAADHLTNKEIAHHLFLSPRTVEYHLHNIFQKLAVGSRRDLPAAIASFPSSDTLPTAG